MYVKQLPAGTMGRISWERLAELFAKSGETKPYERLTHFTADERGITFRVDISPSWPSPDRNYWPSPDRNYWPSPDRNYWLQRFNFNSTAARACADKSHFYRERGEHRMAIYYQARADRASAYRLAARERYRALTL